MIENARFGFRVHRNPGHVHVRVFAATGGAHLGYCGTLKMRHDEWEALDRHLRRGPLNRNRTVEIVEDELSAETVEVPGVSR